MIDLQESKDGPPKPTFWILTRGGCLSRFSAAPFTFLKIQSGALGVAAGFLCWQGERRTDTNRAVESPRLQIGLFVGLALVFLGGLAFSSSYLPGRLATHFGLNGRPDGWMTRSALLTSTALAGLAFPLCVVAICWLARFMPAAIINPPHKEPWLAAGQRRQTSDDLFSHSWWFACLAIGFVTGMYLLLVHGNEQTPPHLSTVAVWALAGAFLTGVGCGILALRRHSNRVT